MTKLYLNGKEIFCEDWSIWKDKENEEIMLTVIYPTGKRYSRPFSEWTVVPTIEMEEALLFNKDSHLFSQISKAIHVGEKFFLVTYPSSEKIYVMNSAQIEILHSTNVTKEYIFDYFKRIAQERLENAKNEDAKIIAKNVIAQFDKIVPCDETVLYAYIKKKLMSREPFGDLIYPFGINETQMNAIQSAFKSQVSVIEGPPGTGKTQTILNIIANIIVNGKTCAIVSNNNSAVENVYEKLMKKELGFLVARLGSGKNRQAFWNSMEYQKVEAPIETIKLEDIRTIYNNIKQYLVLVNKKAQIISEIQEIKTEKEYLEKWLLEHPEIAANYIEKYQLDCVKTVDLLVYIKYLQDRSLTLKDKWELLVNFGIFRSKFLNDIQDRESFVFSLQYTYYRKLLEEKDHERKKMEKELSAADYDLERKQLEEKSLSFLYQYIAGNMPDSVPVFTEDNYRKQFVRFLQYFPVVGSSSHSLISSIANGYLFDYVIIDEASQQDLIPGILCFGCAKNVIVVGDRKQLSHITTNTNLNAPDQYYDCAKYSLLDSVCEVFGADVPKTLLKEHYRCHPKIIQFCNKQFYDDKLIPMKEDHGEDALTLIITAEGNHMRDYKNQREIESVLEVAKDGSILVEKRDGKEYKKGFIAPYNKQVDLAEDMMPSDVVANTIHKFQGKECNEIIFSTVLDKKQISQRQIDFVDNAELVNVAVSRAQDKFVLVTGKDVFTKNNQHVAALIRYIKYYAEKDAVYVSPVISAFDLLYSKYDEALEKLAKKLRPKDSRFKSEQIVAALLRDILQQDDFKMIKFHKQIYLKQLVSDKKVDFTDRETAYIKNRASCDFVLYYLTGKEPLAVIEVDGGYHNTPKQIERDNLKNSILEKVNLPLLRLRTTDSRIAEKMMEFIKKCIGSAPEI